MITAASIQSRRDDILAIAARHGARDVRVFGSVARGDNRPGSDVDLIVRSDPGQIESIVGSMPPET